MTALLTSLGSALGAQQQPSHDGGVAPPVPPFTSQAAALAVPPGCETTPQERAQGTSVFLEEDNFQPPPKTDRNYTMGLGIEWSGCVLHRWRLDAPLALFDHAARGVFHLVKPGGHFPENGDNVEVSTTGMLSGTAFTPRNLRAPTPIIGDRPYAFLLGWTVRRSRPSDQQDHAWTTEATVGTIGSPIGKWVQRGIHAAFRQWNGAPTPYDPKGWPHQILNSPTGIPTARYAVEYEALIEPLEWTECDETERHLEVTYNGQGQLGYYTEADAGLSARLGWFDTPFWAFRSNPLAMGNRVMGLKARKPRAPEQSDGQSGKQPREQRGERPSAPPSEESPGSKPRRFQLFAFGNGLGRLVGYNALMQGYGDWLSDYRIHASQVQRLVGEYNYGVSAVLRFGSENHHSIGATWNIESLRTHEFNTALSRHHRWGSVLLTFSLCNP